MKRILKCGVNNRRRNSEIKNFPTSFRTLLEISALTRWKFTTKRLIISVLLTYSTGYRWKEYKRKANVDNGFGINKKTLDFSRVLVAKRGVEPLTSGL